MKHRNLIISIVFIVFLTASCEKDIPVLPEFPSQNDALTKKDPIGTVTPIISLEQGNSPEGIAFDRRGNMYISNTIGETNQVLKVNLDGTYFVYATLPGGGHARGLTTDFRLNVYVAFATSNPSTNGVYRIDRQGTVLRLRNSEKLISPNSLCFDWYGNLYATDSDGGAVWKYGKDRKFTKLIEDPLLAGGIVPGGPPFPLPGCNGIEFYPPNKLYTANTAQNSICRITIGYFGIESTVELVKQDLLLFNVDGVAIDIHENIYTVSPASTLDALGVPPIPPVVKTNPYTGLITPIVEEDSFFDTPTSIAFGKGWGNYTSVFVTNANLQYGQPTYAGPGVVKVSVGKFGLKKEISNKSF